MDCIKCQAPSPPYTKNKSGRVIFRCTKCHLQFHTLTRTLLNGAQLTDKQIRLLSELLEMRTLKITDIARIVKVSRQTVYNYRRKFHPEPPLEDPPDET